MRVVYARCLCACLCVRIVCVSVHVSVSHQAAKACFSQIQCICRIIVAGIFRGGEGLTG